MNLISYSFLLFFLIAFLIYNILTKKARPYAIIVFGLIFYMWASPLLVLYPIAVTLISFIFGSLLSHVKKQKKLLLVSGIFVILLPLFFTKYLPYCISLLDNSSSLSFAIPIGISYFTLEAIGYISDVYKDPSNFCSFFELLEFYLFFPKILSGPICKPGHLVPQIVSSTESDHKELSYGIVRMLTGLFKKVVIADNLAEFVENAFSSPDNTPGPALIICAFLYSFQLFFDFTGCMDIVIGTAKCFGISLPENFKTPYFSSSIKEFWNRWHITLSEWYRDHIYFPLGGSKKGRFSTCLNILLVFILSGLWHGAGITFLLWGLWHGFLRSMEILFNHHKNKDGHSLSVFCEYLKKALVFFAVTFGWIMFRSDSVGNFMKYIKSTAYYWNMDSVLNWFYDIVISKYSNSIVYAKLIFSLFILSVIAAIISDIICYHSEKSDEYKPCPVASLPQKIKIPVLILMIILILLTGNFGSSSFIYYKFD